MRIYSFRYAVFCGLISALCFGLTKPAHAVATITTGPTLVGSPLTSETNPLKNGVTVQMTVDGTTDHVQVVFSQVSPVDSSLTQVATLTQAVTGGSSPQIFWNALWLIGTDLGRHSGTFAYQATPIAAGSPGTSLPVAGDASALFTINSVDIHNIFIIPSLDTAGQPTFPFSITYSLAKAARVSAAISNSSGTLVSTLLSAKSQGSEQEGVSTNTITWNGLTDAGKTAPIGNYSVTLNATDLSSGDPALQRTKGFSVVSLAGAAGDPQKTFEDSVFVYPNPVRNSQGIFQMEAVRDGAVLSLKIYTITGTLVRQQSFSGIPAGTVTTFTWDGTNQSGNKVGRGLYYYVVREDDSTGTLQTVKKMAVLP